MSRFNRQNFGSRFAPRGPQQFAQPGNNMGNQGYNPVGQGGMGAQPQPMPSPGGGFGAGPQQQQFGPQMAPRGPSQFAQPGTGNAGGRQQFGSQMAPRGPQQFGQGPGGGGVGPGAQPVAMNGRMGAQPQPMPAPGGSMQNFGSQLAPRGPQQFGQQQNLGRPGPMPSPSPGGGGDPRFAPRGPQQWMPQGQNRTGRIPGGQGRLGGGGTGGMQNFGPQMAPRGPQQFAQPNPGYGTPGGPTDQMAGGQPMPASQQGGYRRPSPRMNVGSDIPTAQPENLRAGR